MAGYTSVDLHCIEVQASALPKIEDCGHGPSQYLRWFRARYLKGPQVPMFRIWRWHGRWWFRPPVDSGDTVSCPQLWLVARSDELSQFQVQTGPGWQRRRRRRSAETDRVRWGRRL